MINTSEKLLMHREKRFPIPTAHSSFVCVTPILWFWKLPYIPRSVIEGVSNFTLICTNA